MVFLFSAVFLCQAQKEGNIWYFGTNAGIDFNSGSAVALNDGALSTTEGCACISDANGQLLFYTDGITVWNRYHQQMPNGTGLHGDPSSSQSGVIVPAPGRKNIYYVFTIGLISSEFGFEYSLVDMNADNGMGDVVEKNHPILVNVTERITAVRHRNNKDMWIITHEWNSDAFYAYTLSAAGFNFQPVISHTGMTHQGSDGNSIGLLKSNPDGSNLAIAIRDEKKFELFDFDNQTGLISNPITIDAPGVTYGIEFSPNGSLMYVSAGSDAYLAQYDLQAGSAENIIASQYVLKSPDHDGWSGALQIAPDGKIYLTIYAKSFLGVINNPNLRGAACNYVYEGFALNGASGQLGLPTFIQSYFEQTVFEEKVTYFEETQEVKTNQTLILKNILFDFNKSTLQSQSFVELDKVIKMLKEKPEFKIELRGHTDNIGNKSYNIKLSEDRAKAVGAYFISKGIPTGRITYKGFGSSMPIAGNADEENRKLNRRVEFILTK